MRDYMPKIAGAVLLAAAFVLLLMAPPPPRFSILNLYGFLACFVCGFLLLAGYFGTHPAASQARREALKGSKPRTGSLCSVSEQIFPAVIHSRGRILRIAVCTVLGLALLTLGIILSRLLPGDYGLAGLPLWAAAALCIWLPLRQSRMYIRIDATGMRARTYFRNVEIGWSDVVALIARQHSILLPGAYHIPLFGRIGTIYSVYSQGAKIEFVRQTPNADQLAAIISSATGLGWE